MEEEKDTGRVMGRMDFGLDCLPGANDHFVLSTLTLQLELVGREDWMPML